LQRQYLKKGKYPRILALTASPGTDLEKINEICQNLGIEEIEVRTKDDADVVKRTKGVSNAAGIFIQTLAVEKDKEMTYTMVFGQPTGSDYYVFEPIGRFKAEKGRAIKSGDKFKALIGPQFTKENGISGNNHPDNKKVEE
jgi:hypothetical protein